MAPKHSKIAGKSTSRDLINAAPRNTLVCPKIRKQGEGSMLLSYLLRHLVRRGTLRIIDAGGRLHSFSGEAGPTITLRFHDPALLRELFFYPRLALVEAFMDGRLTVQDASVYDLLDFLCDNINRAPRNVLTPLYNGFDSKLGNALRVFQQYN